jgi:hypothetical protein
VTICHIKVVEGHFHLLLLSFSLPKLEILLGNLNILHNKKLLFTFIRFWLFFSMHSNIPIWCDVFYHHFKMEVLVISKAWFYLYMKSKIMETFRIQFVGFFPWNCIVCIIINKICKLHDTSWWMVTWWFYKLHYLS